MKKTGTLLPLLFAASTYAHGILSKMTINGQSYMGNGLSGNGGTTIDSVIRQVSAQDPVKGASNTALSCGTNSQPAKLIATANPGDELGFNWKGAGGGNWPHNTGPMLTYLASCGSTTCDKFDAQSAKWFKIDQVGQVSPGSTTWAQQSVMTGSLAMVKLPSNLAPGNYLVRHEIISLQLAVSPGGAEFYPACSQLKVGGSGTGAPTQSELVSFPGAYSDTDPGIYDPNVYNSGSPYTFPGPPVAAFVGNGGGSTSGGTTTSGNGTTTSTTTGSAPAHSTATKSKTCKLRQTKSASSSVSSSTGAGYATDLYPRHFSRIMRKVVARRSI
ncbi:lytic polysaccharide monooxygenase [Laccaria amethystina LaAM-08-1]|uniref:lytic cellulose monooxygenase (C4-dehydrogenating) n=1 Tax=Laccaria amethystina LaAM-08-1 TaxID=1095629 RepID=A0A0C9WMV0_9AGAR|nr:lytic polysaccharide monooxygenase [Laccaria amethystina LaAM-08-1]